MADFEAYGEMANDRNDAERFKGLRVCKKLTGNALFHVGGNGLGQSFESKLVMWFAEPRKEGQPNKRTKKSEVCGYLQQDAVDALVAFANIAEKVAPYVWQADPHPNAPERGWVGEGGKGSKVLVGEAGLFVERFGLPHMRSDGTGPETGGTPLSAGTLRFTASYEADHAAEVNRLKSALAAPGGEISREMYRRRLVEGGLYVEGDAVATGERLFLDGLRPFAKDFASISDFRRERRALEAERDRLEGLMRDTADGGAADRRFAEARRLQGEISLLHLDKGMLVLAAERAYDDFSGEERGSLEADGYVMPDVEGMYRIGLLFHDAIELHMAIQGDGPAFERVLTKVHMELFDVDGPVSDEDDARMDFARSVAEGRYTIWFESCGYDPTNPGSDARRDSYEIEAGGALLKMRRKESRWNEQEHYGCGRVVHVLCDPGEEPQAFREIARKYLPCFLEGLIREGVDLNYRGAFAEPAAVDPKKPVVIVNDFGNDLVRTLWIVMDLVNKGAIPLNVSRCKCCGRLMNTAREAGNAREFCDASCRSLHRKRVAAREKSGEETEDARMRREFLEYMESGDAVRVGMIAHMGLDMHPAPEPEKRGVLEALLRDILGLPDGPAGAIR